MRQFNPEIDAISQDAAKYMEEIILSYHELKIDIEADYEKGTAAVAFRLGYGYFKTAFEALAKNNLLGGGLAVRTCLENLSDLYYIFDNTPHRTAKYSKAYVESIEKFRQAMVDAAGKTSEEVFTSGILKEANRWTNASVSDRIEASGKANSNIYDMFSYLSHPNPGAITYFTSSELKKGQLNLLKQSNCLVAVHLMGLIIHHSDVESVTFEELDELAVKLGSRITPE